MIDGDRRLCTTIVEVEAYHFLPQVQVKVFSLSIFSSTDGGREGGLGPTRNVVDWKLPPNDASGVGFTMISSTLAPTK